MSSIKVGTCGFRYYNPPGNWKERYKSKLQAYSDAFKVVELNKTFYGLPMVKTTQRWREEVLGEFEFTLKAWQAITHPTTSMTWRKRTEQLTERQKENFGNLRPNQEVMEAWEENKERAEALGATICVLQCPASFTCSAENEDNMRRFFEKIDRKGLEPAWEPRGDWNEHPEKIASLCSDLGLIHIVDLMRREPLSEHPTAYVRLHGLNRKEYDYRYDYSDSELEQLAEKLTRLAKRHKTVYCMFNNDNMFANAQSLMKLLQG
jgi:uncharacterized protein YecE (DUF72 family)